MTLPSIILFFVVCLGCIKPQSASAEIAIPPARESAPVSVSAELASRWREGGYEVWLLSGNCQFKQGDRQVKCGEAVVWLDLAKPTDEDRRDKAIIYAETDVAVSFGDNRSNDETNKDSDSLNADPQRVLRDQQWMGRMITAAGIKVDVGTLRGKPVTDSPIIERAISYRKNDVIGRVVPVQWTEATESPVFEPSVFEPEDLRPNGSAYELSQLPGGTVLDAESSGWQTLPPTGIPLPADTPDFPLFDSTSGWATPDSESQQFRQPLGDGSGNFNGERYPSAGLIPDIAGISETRVRFLPRAGQAPSLRSFPSPAGNEQIWIASGGVKVIVESDQLRQPNTMDPDSDGRVVIEADEVVAWTNSLAQLQANGQPIGQADKRWELYLEGNIVFATGRRVIYADRMYYDTMLSRGTILNAELLTPVPKYEGLVRLKSDVLQQLDQNTFQAYGAAVTSSRLGVPRYWLQSNNIQLTQSTREAYDSITGQMQVDPNTGLPETESNYQLTSRGNSIYIGQIPVFYWPTLRADLTESSYYINNLQFKNDGVFGTQILTEFDLFQLLGIRNRPDGTDWTLDVDYLSKRGPALGTNYNYQSLNPFGTPASYFGELDAWGIKDDGVDNLGADRRDIVPEQTWRGRVKFEHQYYFGEGLQLNAQAGYISDRNFLESFYEREWDNEPDQLTRIQLSRILGDQSFNVEGSVRVNDFFMETETLPRLDHFLLGRNLLFDRATYFAHSQVGYHRLRVADAPTDPVELGLFTPLPGEAEHEGVKATTRQEIDFPIDLGPVKTVPYLLGEMSYWGEDLTGDSLSRSYGQLGIRNSLPVWRADNSINSELLNLNGLAHKVTFESDFYYSDATEDLSTLPRYYQLDDNAQEQFRRRFTFQTFGGAVPLKFDDRLYAFRSNQQGYVTSPASEIADDQFAVDFGVHQRWQTKRGAPGRQRTVDWITFDVDATWFLEDERDNFGAPLGLVNYDFRWHLGDRVSILSDGFLDFFGQGLRTSSIGVQANRPGVGDVYAGFRSIEGPISSNVLISSYNYRLSEKWIVTAGSSYDFGPAGNLGQQVSLTRIGESFLTRFGINSDVSRGNFGFVFGIEPRFYAKSRSTTLGGVPLPPVGTQGLE